MLDMAPGQVAVDAWLVNWGPLAAYYARGMITSKWLTPPYADSCSRVQVLPTPAVAGKNGNLFKDNEQELMDVIRM